MLEHKKYSKIVKDYAELLKYKKSLGSYSNKKNVMGNLIKIETQFLDVIEPTMRIRVLYILNDFYDIIKCPICDNHAKLEIDNKFNYKVKGCSVKCCNNIYKNTKDPISGLTNYQIRNIKGANTKRKIINENGQNIFDIASKKISITLNKIDSNGETIISNRKQKYFDTIHKLQKSGKTKAEEISIKSTKTKNIKIDLETGLTISKSIGIKVSKSKSKIMSDGRTKGQHDREKGKITINQKIFNIRSEYLTNNDLILLTKYSDIVYNDIKLLKYSCNKCNSIRESYWPYIRCTTCYPYNRSMGENEVLEFCKSLSPNIQSNPRNIIPPLELDMYLPDHNLAIEYDGIYWHSSDSMETENKDYHLHKTEHCTSKGIQLFHIFENEWQDPQKQLIWKSIISNRLGKSQRIFARKTEVRSVTSGDTREFLNINHLQGSCVSSVNLGLYLEGRLVSIMTFGKSRYDKSMDWELLRFCNEIGISVVGGASKLLSAFRKENIGSIVSYADKRRSDGNLYERLGFRLSHESSPNYFYVKNGILESRIRYQKHKLEDQLDKFDVDLSETQNMYNNGYRKIYDCGNSVWKL